MQENPRSANNRIIDSISFTSLGRFCRCRGHIGLTALGHDPIARAERLIDGRGTFRRLRTQSGKLVQTDIAFPHLKHEAREPCGKVPDRRFGRIERIKNYWWERGQQIGERSNTAVHQSTAPSREG